MQHHVEASHGNERCSIPEKLQTKVFKDIADLSFLGICLRSRFALSRHPSVLFNRQLADVKRFRRAFVKRHFGAVRPVALAVPKLLAPEKTLLPSVGKSHHGTFQLRSL